MRMRHRHWLMTGLAVVRFLQLHRDEARVVVIFDFMARNASALHCGMDVVAGGIAVRVIVVPGSVVLTGIWRRLVVRGIQPHIRRERRDLEREIVFRRIDSRRRGLQKAQLSGPRIKLHARAVGALSAIALMKESAKPGLRRTQETQPPREIEERIPSHYIEARSGEDLPRLRRVDLDGMLVEDSD